LGGRGAPAGRGGIALAGSDGADDDDRVAFGTAGGRPKLVGLPDKSE
jgi:hypothetical protein